MANYDVIEEGGAVLYDIRTNRTAIYTVPDPYFGFVRCVKRSSIHPTGPLGHRTMSPMLAYVSDVPCILGVNIMRMAVVWLQSPLGLWSRLKDLFNIHSSRTAMATVRMGRFV